MPKRNVELLTQVRDLIQAEPAKLDMASWGCVKEVEDLGYSETVKVDCGTTACIAGWAVQLAGDKFLVRGFNPSPEGGYFVSDSVAKNGRVCNIEDRAQKLLGLTYDEANQLFINTPNEDALDVLNQLIAGEDIAPDDDYDDD
jgi:hypothetical protein